jgi:FkbM family methyltransferase
MTIIDFHGVRLGMTHLGDAITSAWKPEEAALVIQCIEPGDRVLVAGGGFGWTACLVASIVGRENVVVYEANPDLATYLSHNIRVDGRPLRVLNLALSDTTSQGQLWEHPHWGASSLNRRVGEHGRMIPVRTWAVNDAVRRDSINALILDIEGSEWECARALDWSPIRAAVIEVHDGYLDRAGKRGQDVDEWMVAGGLVKVGERTRDGDMSRWIAGVRG